MSACSSEASWSRPGQAYDFVKGVCLVSPAQIHESAALPRLRSSRDESRFRVMPTGSKFWASEKSMLNLRECVRKWR